MKLNKLFSTVTICIAGCIAFTSCKKDDQTIAPSCKITTVAGTVTGGGSSLYTITYNADGRISTLTSGNSITTFSYNGNTIIENTTTGGAFASKETITNNAAGYATYTHTETNAAGTVWYDQALEYNGTQLIKVTGTSSSSPNPSVSTYTWSAGNLTTVTAGNTSSTLDYYTDKAAAGDYLELSELLQGIKIYNNKNAIKSITSPGSSVTSFVYDYNTDGKTSKVTISVGGVTSTVYSYGYTCK